MKFLFHIFPLLYRKERARAPFLVHERSRSLITHSCMTILQIHLLFPVSFRDDFKLKNSMRNNHDNIENMKEELRNDYDFKFN